MQSLFTKPTTAQNHSPALLFCLLIFILTFGDYYVLSHEQEVHQARTWQKGLLLANSKPQKVSNQVLQHRADKPVSLDREGSKPAITGENLRYSFKQRLLLKAAYIYDKAGIYIRGILLMASLLLLFGQKAPVKKPGQSRLRPIGEKSRKLVYLVSGLIFMLSSYVLLFIHNYSSGFITYAYPITILLLLGSSFISGMIWARNKKPAFVLSTARRRIDSPNGFSLPTKDGGYINVPNAFRGNLVLGGAGAGKSFSIGEPIIQQFAEKNLAGIIYDFKFPVLVEVAQQAMATAALKRTVAKEKNDPVEAVAQEQEPVVQLHIINFRDMERTERVNPLRAENMPVVAFAEEYSRAIINNLNTNTIKNTGEFFSTSAIAFLTAIIWFYRKKYPKYCTIPHVVATALYKDFRHVLSMLDTDVECGDMVRSLITAVESKAEKQIAGVVATLQIILTRINSPEMVWVLTPNEEKGEGFSLNLNDPKKPKLLCIGNDPTLKDSFSPVISCIITVALKLMNQQGKHPSYVFLDEAATIYVPGLEIIPATARSNKIATIYMSQDLSQMVDSYGREKMQVMISNLNNWFIGKVNNIETAELISKIVGREEKETVSTSTGSSVAGNGLHNRSLNQSVSFQERNLVRIQDSISLEQGEFIGQTVETDPIFFKGFISREEALTARMPLEPFVQFTDEKQLVQKADVKASIIQANFQKVREEVKNTIGLYPNMLVPQES